MNKSKDNDFRHLTVLVTGVGGPTGQGILQSLYTIKNKPSILGSDISPTAAGFFWTDKSFVLPHSSQMEDYLIKLKEICNKYKVNIIFPGSDGEARKITDQNFQINGIEIAASNRPVWKTVGDKLLLNKLCLKLEIASPTTYPLSISNLMKLAKESGFPVVIKQRIGSGSRGIRSLSDLDSANMVIKDLKTDEYILQEYLPIEQSEYTVGTYFDLHSPDYNDPVMIAYRRTLYHGNTISAITVSPQLFHKEISNIGSHLGLKGYVNFQFILRNNKAYLIDLNTRFSSSISMALSLGYNWVETYLNNLIYNQKPKKLKYRAGIVISRYLADVILSNSIQSYV